jgi:FAD/FMN-containing dehydrogenase
MWKQLSAQVEGRLIAVESPVENCRRSGDEAACRELFRELKNPYYIGDHPALTQTSGWVDAWTSEPSAFAIAAENGADVAAGVNFAREHNLRLVVKGGGHSYKGTSNARDSLLIWTRRMNGIELHERFVPQGCDGMKPQPAVTAGAGAIWGQMYRAVSVEGGRYVQGGGCTTVGVAGLIQSGGFGSFSKRYGLAAAGLLEAEVVTADGRVRIANACTNPDLFWGLKGGGGGSLGVVTKVTLRTRELPEYFGGVFGTIKARSDAAYRRLIAKVLGFYEAHLFNPHWGEQMRFDGENTLELSMVFQGLNQAQAKEVWQPFLDWVKAAPAEFIIEKEVFVLEIPARDFWNPHVLQNLAPGAVVFDDRPNAPGSNFLWEGDHGQVGWVIHDYKSAWLPAGLLAPEEKGRLAEAIFAASRHWGVSLHFNKGLAGAPAEEIAAARETAMNPAVLDAFALAIIATGEGPAFPGIAGHEPDAGSAAENSRAVTAAMQELLKVVADRGSYVSESDYFEPGWQQSFWGRRNHRRLAAVKERYDPQGLFFVYHGVGSEKWSRDGFTELNG